MSVSENFQRYSFIRASSTCEGNTKKLDICHIITKFERLDLWLGDMENPHDLNPAQKFILCFTSS